MARFSDVITARRLRIRCHAGRTNCRKFAFLFWRFITLTVRSHRPKALSAVLTVCGAAHERSRRQKVRRRVQKSVKSDRNFSASFQHLPAALRQLLLQCCMVQSLQVYLCQWQKKVLFFFFFFKKGSLFSLQAAVRDHVRCRACAVGVAISLTWLMVNDETLPLKFNLSNF